MTQCNGQRTIGTVSQVFIAVANTIAAKRIGCQLTAVQCVQWQRLKKALLVKDEMENGELTL